MSASLKVKIFESRGTRTLHVTKSSMTIGSAVHCDLVLADPTVGAEHVRVWLDGGRIWVQDLGGPAGTSLNEIRLPALKPMLMRDLDLLRLGQSEATLGIEALLVRAPVVKAQVATPAQTNFQAQTQTQLPTQTAPITVPPPVPAREPEIEKRREELRQLGRELAEVRLHLQMNRLDRTAAEEINQQLQNLRDETKAVELQKLKWTETLKQLEVDKIQARKDSARELAEHKQNLQSEFKEHTDREERKVLQWKRNTTTELQKATHSIAHQKSVAWAGRAFTADMVVEWETELEATFRRVLLNESGSAAATAPSVATPAPVAIAQPAANEVARAVGTQAPASTPAVIQDFDGDFTASRIKIRRSALEKPRTLLNEMLGGEGQWKSVGITSVGVLAIIFGCWLAMSYYKQRGSRSFSSSNSSRSETRAKTAARFSPKQNRKYRGTYTENVLYLENYLAAEQNRDFHTLWQTELNRVASTEWKADPGAATQILTKEQALLNDLSRLREGITPDREQEGIIQMRAREAVYVHDLETTLKTRAAVDRFLKFKRSFYVRNQAYLSREAG